MDDRFSRFPRRAELARVPRAVDRSLGLFVVDATWGVIQPMTLAPGVETVGELEVIEHLRAGRPLLDCRQPEYLARGTIPGAVNIPHGEMVASGSPSFTRCSGPCCSATARSAQRPRRAIEALLAAGWPAERLVYYRGGIHDWVTLGLPLASPAS